MSNAKLFFDTYVQELQRPVVVDIGAQDVNGSLRTACPNSVTYIGVDFVSGQGVDIVLDDPYVLPFDDNSVDVIVSSSCFEHSEMFWILFLEILRVLKPAGLFYLNAPANGEFHRYPVDCWRFYPDCGKALVTWARRSGIDAALLESYTSYQDKDIWNDFVAIFVKNSDCASSHPKRIAERFGDYYNGFSSLTQDEILKYQQYPEDIRKLQVIEAILKNEIHLR
jgi:SAM-dependent methyltransferase